MKRGGLRITKVYSKVEGVNKTQWQIQGRKNGLWIPVVEKDAEGISHQMIYDDKAVAEAKFKEIVDQVVAAERNRKVVGGMKR